MQFLAFARRRRRICRALALPFLGFDALEEELLVDGQRLGELMEATGTDPIFAALVLLHRLEADADQFCEVGLGHAAHNPLQPDARADIDVDRMWAIDDNGTAAVPHLGR